MRPPFDVNIFHCSLFRPRPHRLYQRLDGVLVAFNDCFDFSVVAVPYVAAQPEEFRVPPDERAERYVLYLSRNDYPSRVKRRENKMSEKVLSERGEI